MSEMLEQLRTRERDMELEAIALRSRIEELRSVIELMEQQPQEPVRRRKRSSDSSSDSANATVVNHPSVPWDDEDTAA